MGPLLLSSGMPTAPGRRPAKNRRFNGAAASQQRNGDALDVVEPVIFRFNGAAASQQRNAGGGDYDVACGRRASMGPLLLSSGMGAGVHGERWDRGAASMGPLLLSSGMLNYFGT